MTERDRIILIRDKLNTAILESLENILKAVAILTEEVALIKTKVNQ